ncbi:MAG TPA: DUF2844 domain-containing protein [Syntrophales bacterium]|nr:DUF2844 domain-containing protein [Syntrophales bacterium]
MDVQVIIRYVILRVLILVVTLVVIAFPSPVTAALGDDVATVQSDQIRMKGALQTTQIGTHTVHEIKIPAGTVVREYVSNAGKIFAVTWQGPHVPDLRQLLGSHFDQFSQAVKDRKAKQPWIRGPLMIQEPGLVVHTGGHMRAYFGKAYIPELVPQGVSIEDLK